MKKRALALILAAAILAAAMPVWAADEAPQGLTSLGIINGYPDGSFRAENFLTRAEAAKMVALALMYDGEADITGIPQDSQGHWSINYIGFCIDGGLMIVDENGAFRPNAQMSYAEFGVICRRLTGEVVADGDWNTEDSTPIARGHAADMLWEAMNTQSVGGSKGGNLYTSHLVKAATGGKLLQNYALAGYVTDGQINATKIDADAAVYVWDYGRWAVATDFDIEYSFVALYDGDGDSAADTVLAVEYGDGFWDEKSMAGVDFDDIYTIFYGQRIENFGIGGAADDYSNIVARGDLENSTYWPTYDWYNTTSTDTLTFLTNFKTTQQTNGWACGVSSAVMAMEWYGLRGDLNEIDLSTLRDKVIDDTWRWGGYTDTRMLINVFENLNDMAGTEVWQWQSTYDFLNDDGEFDWNNYLSSAWIQENLQLGRPILVGWNSFGGHWQVIIGYDNMGTESEADDVLLLADPYDTTDHLNDGVNIQNYWRFVYDYTQDFDRDFGRSDGYGFPVMLMAYPADGFEWKPVMGDGLKANSGEVWSRTGNMSDDMLLDYGTTAADLEASGYESAKAQRGENGLAGPASSDYFHTSFDVEKSPYFAGFDFYNATQGSITDTLVLLPQFKTAQQASEWTCGPASLRMALAFFNGEEDLPSEFALSALRQNDKEGATTLDGMIDILTALNADGGDWAWLSTDDMDDDWNIGGTELNLEADFVQFCIANGIPVVIGWDEWGGHWQVIIGFDDMGTEATQDDVIILADPYDTGDHCQDGYVIESWERLVYGWGAAFDERGSEVFIAFAPASVFEAAELPVK